jgi:hypothetical protein
MTDPVTKPGDIIHIDTGRAVQVIDAVLADWPCIDSDAGTVRCVVVRTRPTRREPLRKDDPRVGITERILASLSCSRRAA